MAFHNQTGRIGENLAASFLNEKGFHILHRNWRHKHWEVDIIASRLGVLHFVEVKTRRSLRFGFPEENVSKHKIQYLINAAEKYIYENSKWERIQCDVLSILILPNCSPNFFFIEDIYL